MDDRRINESNNGERPVRRRPQGSGERTLRPRPQGSGTRSQGAGERTARPRPQGSGARPQGSGERTARPRPQGSGTRSQGYGERTVRPRPQGSGTRSRDHGERPVRPQRDRSDMEALRLERRRKREQEVRRNRIILAGAVIGLILVIVIIVAIVKNSGSKTDITANTGNNASSEAINLSSETGNTQQTGKTTANTETASTEKAVVEGKLALDGDKLVISYADGTKSPGTGWQQLDGNWYFGSEDGTIAKDMIVSLDGKDYYLGEDGVMVKGKTVSTGGILYVAAEDGSLSMGPGWQKVDGKWVYYNEDGTISDNKRGGYTIDQYLGCSNLIGWMMDHFNDYYFKTNFAPMTDYLNDVDMLLRPYGEYGDSSTMNCTGFVAHCLKNAGGDLSKVSAMGKKGGYTNADSYYKLAVNGYVQYYVYDSVDALLQSGKARKGDILYLEPNWSNGGDCHIGFFWGDTPDDNKFWNQDWYYDGNKNAVTVIQMEDPIQKIYLIPIAGS